MKSIKTSVGFYREKEDNLELEELLENKGFNTDKILYLGYEVNMEVEIFEDGINKVISIQGIDVSDKDIWI